MIAKSPTCFLSVVAHFFTRKMPGSSAAVIVCFFGVMGSNLPAAGYYLTGTDDPSTSSFNAAGKWNAGGAPSSGNYYIVGNARALRTPTGNQNYTFAGDYLQLEKTDTANPAQLAMCGTGTITINDLRLKGGTVASWAGSSQPVLAGNITLLAEGGIFSVAGGNTGLRINSKISGTGLLTISGGAGNNVTMTGAGSTWTGGTLISAGVKLTTWNDHALGMGNVTMEAGSSLTMTTAGVMDGSASLIISVESGKTTTVDFGSSGASIVISSFVINGNTHTNTSLANLVSIYSGLSVTGNGSISATAIPEPANVAFVVGMLFVIMGLVARRRFSK